ncbi:ABC-2 transporter permease [Gorillibacterium massiliense]|uniref:ABC-2 transporter permease n=1 Tax=Gorillibacterium massiliense TaxID=1280390 RepID=UPI0005942648|nr:ABC-2 transporter permease [Gorillibacterium massiliense]
MGPFLQDVAYLAAAAVMGFAMSRDYLEYWKTRPFTRKLTVLCTLPIETKDLVAAKYLTTTRNLLINGLVFFGTQYLISEDIRKTLPGFHYVLFVIFWLGIFIAFTAFYLYLEMGCTEKKYLLSNMIIGAILLLVFGLINGITGSGLISHSMEWISSYGIAASLLSLLAGLVITAYVAGKTVQKLDNRDVA